jgi:hypothetical protein
VWGGEWHSIEWCSRGCVGVGFWRWGVLWWGDFEIATRCRDTTTKISYRDTLL